jgi:hypothetical protein
LKEKFNVFSLRNFDLQISQEKFERNFGWLLVVMVVRRGVFT